MLKRIQIDSIEKELLWEDWEQLDYLLKEWALDWDENTESIIEEMILDVKEKIDLVDKLAINYFER